jgi:hypothetical protein
MTEADFKELVAKANARYAAYSPEEKRAHDDAQRQSWVRGMTTGCEHGVLDFEQCPKCRGWE